MNYCLKGYIEQEFFDLVKNASSEVTEGLHNLNIPIDNVKYFDTHLAGYQERYFVMTHKISPTSRGRYVQPTLVKELAEDDLLDRLFKLKTQAKRLINNNLMNNLN